MEGKTVSIVGFGKFGKCLLNDILRCPATVYDPRPEALIELGEFAKPVSLEIAACADIIYLAVPLSRVESVLAALVPNMAPGSILIDCCSVQMKAAESLHFFLANSEKSFVQLHCLFGPQTVARVKSSSQRLSAVLSPMEDSGLADEWVDNFITYLDGQGVDVNISAPLLHDQSMASTMALCHLLAQALIRMRVHKIDPKYHTHSFRCLLEMVNILSDDLPEPYATVVGGNQFAKPVLDRLILELQALRETW